MKHCEFLTKADETIKLPISNPNTIAPSHFTGKHYTVVEL